MKQANEWTTRRFSLYQQMAAMSYLVEKKDK
jgi:hypothetical protein